jgi:hypothetical protein
LIDHLVREVHPQYIYEILWPGETVAECRYSSATGAGPPKNVRGLILVQFVEGMTWEVYRVTARPFQALRRRKDAVVVCDASFESGLKQNFPRTIQSTTRIKLKDAAFITLVLVGL